MILLRSPDPKRLNHAAYSLLVYKFLMHTGEYPRFEILETIWHRLDKKQTLKSFVHKK